MDEQNMNPVQAPMQTTQNLGPAENLISAPEKKKHIGAIIVIALAIIVLIGLFLAFYQRGKYLTTELQETGASTVREASPQTGNQSSSTNSATTPTSPDEDLASVEAELNMMNTASLDE